MVGGFLTDRRFRLTLPLALALALTATACHGAGAGGMATVGHAYAEQEAFTDAELDQVGDMLVAALAAAGDGGPGAGTLFDRLRAAPAPIAAGGERFPSRLTKVVWSCRRPVDDDLRALLTRFCRAPSDRYAEVYAAGFTMWQTFDKVSCDDCFTRHRARRDRFVLGTLATKLARAGYVARGPSGEQRFTLGLPTPVGHVFARSDGGPVVLLSSGGIDPRTRAAAANSVVLTFFVYLPVNRGS